MYQAKFTVQMFEIASGQFDFIPEISLLFHSIGQPNQVNLTLEFDELREQKKVSLLLNKSSTSFHRQETILNILIKNLIIVFSLLLKLLYCYHIFSSLK